MLEKSFKRSGFHHNFLSAANGFAIYHKGYTQGIRSDGTRMTPVAQYEVIKPIWYKDKGWCYPGSSMWGIYGWSTSGDAEVLKMFEKIVGAPIDQLDITKDFDVFVSTLPQQPTE